MNPVAERSNRSVGRTRQRNQTLIIAAAEKTFARYGYQGTSMGLIARCAGLPKANLFYYYPGKQTLYVELLQAILGVWQAGLERLHPNDDPATALTGYIRAKFEYAWNNPQASRILALEIISGAPFLNALLDEEHQAWLQARASLFDAWAAAGKMDRIDPRYLLFMIWASTQHYTALPWRTGSPGNPQDLPRAVREQSCANLTGIILKGCGLDHPSQPMV